MDGRRSWSVCNLLKTSTAVCVYNYKNNMFKKKNRCRWNHINHRALVPVLVQHSTFVCCLSCLLLVYYTTFNRFKIQEFKSTPLLVLSTGSFLKVFVFLNNKRKLMFVIYVSFLVAMLQLLSCVLNFISVCHRYVCTIVSGMCVP